MHASAFGYVDKDHYLYPIMIDIRYKKYDEAMAKLEPYAEQGDAKALFWYGYMKQSNWGRDRFGAYRWYEKSIGGRNPYSMFKLSGEDGTGYVCEVNGWECPEENLDKALERWKELADKGDARAEYYYWFYNRSFFEVGFDAWFTDNNEKAIIKAAEKGYYLPLARSIKAAYGKSYQGFWGREMYQTLLKNVEEDPKITMHFVIHPDENMNEGYRKKLLFDILKKGYRVSYFDRFLDEGLISGNEAYVFIKADYLGSEEEFDQNYYVEKFNIEEEKISELNKEAEGFFNSIEHVINFDEMEFMYFSKPDV